MLEIVAHLAEEEITLLTHGMVSLMNGYSKKDLIFKTPFELVMESLYSLILF